ncbi:MAG: type 1 glutamine amidotransferase domain-containing protein [Candidatus Competibacteraceae bacterium]
MAKIAVLLAADFEDSEFTIPYERLKKAGHQVTVVGRKAEETVKGKQQEATVTIETTAQGLDPAKFDAVVIPGGYSPDKLRLDPDIVGFVRQFAHSGKLIGAVCHGPQLLIEADAVAGRTLTSWPSVRKDLENAGAHWVDREVVEDGNLVTSRQPADLDAFSKALVDRLQIRQPATAET